jgi:hypothetical protein
MSKVELEKGGTELDREIRRGAVRRAVFQPGAGKGSLGQTVPEPLYARLLSTRYRRCSGAAGFRLRRNMKIRAPAATTVMPPMRTNSVGIVISFLSGNRAYKQKGARIPWAVTAFRKNSIKRIQIA